MDRLNGKPVVSIITATYNHERYIGPCIDSVLAQTFSNWELLIVDDGSTDKTQSVVQAYDDVRIRYYSQTNKGMWRLSETYNRALAEARGEYVAILEGDDLWPPARLQLQIDHMLNSDAVVAFGRYERIDCEGRLLKGSESRLTNETRLLTKDEALRRLLIGELTVMPVTALIRKDVLESIGGFQQEPYYPAVEHPTWLRLALEGSFLEQDTVLGHWRRHPKQASDALGIALSDGLLRMNMEFFEKLPDKIRNRIGVTAEWLKRHQRIAFASAKFSHGRYQLLAGQRKAAKASFMRAAVDGDWRVRSKASLGFIAAVLNLDFEDIIMRMGFEPFELPSKKLHE